MHGDHGPLCALMKAHVDVGDDHGSMHVEGSYELHYGDGDHSKMWVDGDHESMHVEDSYELHYGDGDHSKM